MKARLRLTLAFIGLGTACIAPDALAWGDKGHQITALIAYRHLTDKARSALEALLASDTDTLTPKDFASRASWADRYRNTHRETAAWHYVNLEIGQPDLDSACFHFPPPGNLPASFGPAQDCVVNKIEQFGAELKDPGTAPAERLLALKFLIHFVGDLHQPLHAADHQDRGGNCVNLASPAGQATNLHAFWDVNAVEALTGSAAQIADALDADVTPEQTKQWSAGNARDWALESFALGQQDVYNLPSLPTCTTPGAVVLSDEYQLQAMRAASLQLKRAGLRMAALLNAAFDPGH